MLKLDMSSDELEGGQRPNWASKNKDKIFGGRGRKKKKFKEGKIGQTKNALERHAHGEKTPEEEIGFVLASVKRRDGESLEMAETNKYIKWLKERLMEKEFDFGKEKFSEFEKITASVGAGGAGRQTARNARARRHLITSLRVTAEQDRKGFPNEEIVMKKLEKKVRRHLGNWRIVLGDGLTQPTRGTELGGQVGEEVMKRITPPMAG